RLRRLRGQRLIEEPAFAGHPFAVELRATNLGRAVLYGVGLEDHEPNRTLFAFTPRLPGGHTMLHRGEAALPKRGRYPWGGLGATSAYPFGLAQRRVRLLADQEVLILPRLGRLHRGRLRRFLTPIGLAHAPTRRQARRHPTAQAEFHGLRAFRSGDSPRWIHWRTSARCGELMVREFEDVPTDNLVLVVDPAAGPGLEEAISLAATICWEWCRQRGDHFVLALAGTSSVVLRGATGWAHALNMLGCLAGLEGEQD